VVVSKLAVAYGKVDLAAQSLGFEEEPSATGNERTLTGVRSIIN